MTFETPCIFGMFVDVAFPEVGWFTAWNGYKYRVSNSSSSWWDARRECQSYEGDLAAPGMRNMNLRRYKT